MPIALVQAIEVIPESTIANQSGVVAIQGQPWAVVSALNSPGLRDLRMDYCGARSLTLSNNPALHSISAQGNAIRWVDFKDSGQLRFLNLNNNPLIVLDLHRLQNLVVARANDCDLIRLNGYFCGELVQLECSGNPRLADLGFLRDCPKLAFLNAYGLPQVTTIDISHNPELLLIDLGGNALTVAAVDHVLNCLDRAGKWYGLAALFATNIPSPAAAPAIANLLARGWTLQLDTGQQ